MHTFTPGSCHGVIRMVCTRQVTVKVSNVDNSCLTILPGQGNVFKLQPHQHISAQLIHDNHLNWSAQLNRHLSLEYLPKLQRPRVHFRFFCFPAGVARTFIQNTMFFFCFFFRETHIICLYAVIWWQIDINVSQRLNVC